MVDLARGIEETTWISIKQTAALKFSTAVVFYLFCCDQNSLPVKRRVICGYHWKWTMVLTSSSMDLSR